jgi:hypothetical protein
MPIQIIEAPTIKNFEDFLKGNGFETLQINHADNPDAALRNLCKATKTIKHDVKALMVKPSKDLTLEGLYALNKFLKNSKLTNLNLDRFNETDFTALLNNLARTPNQNLKKFDLSLFKFKGSQSSLVDGLRWAFPNLNTLGLHAGLTDTDLFLNFPHLTNLNLSGNRIEGTKLFSRRNLHHLQTLDLGDNHIKAQSFMHFHFFTNLTDLDLRFNKLGDKDVQNLSYSLVNLTALRDLKLNWNSDIGNDGVLSLVKNLTQLSKLSVWPNSMNGEGGKLLAKTLGKKTGGLTLNLNFNEMTQAEHASVMEDFIRSETDAIVTLRAGLTYSIKDYRNRNPEIKSYVKFFEFKKWIGDFITINLGEKKEISYEREETQKIESLIRDSFYKDSGMSYFMNGILKISCPNDRQPIEYFKTAISLRHSKMKELQSYIDQIPTHKYQKEEWRQDLFLNAALGFWGKQCGSGPYYSTVDKSLGDFSYEEIIEIKKKMWGLALETFNEMLSNDVICLLLKQSYRRSLFTGSPDCDCKIIRYLLPIELTFRLTT